MNENFVLSNTLVLLRMDINLYRICIIEYLSNTIIRTYQFGLRHVSGMISKKFSKDKKQ